jgi:hypothetical protein
MAETPKYGFLLAAGAGYEAPARPEKPGGSVRKEAGGLVKAAVPKDPVRLEDAASDERQGGPNVRTKGDAGSRP